MDQALAILRVSGQASLRGLDHFPARVRIADQTGPTKPHTFDVRETKALTPAGQGHTTALNQQFFFPGLTDRPVKMTGIRGAKPGR